MVNVFSPLGVMITKTAGQNGLQSPFALSGMAWGWGTEARVFFVHASLLLSVLGRLCENEAPNQSLQGTKSSRKHDHSHIALRAAIRYTIQFFFERACVFVCECASDQLLGNLA